jgi:hypothetical protein
LEGEQRRNETLLGDIIVEGQGKTVGMRVLPNGKIEHTWIMEGLFLEEEFQGTWTSETEIRPDRTAYHVLHGFFTTKSGEMGRYTGMGNGTLGPDGTSVWRGFMCFTNPPGKYAKLNGIAAIWEVEADKEGILHNKGWEWK